MRKLSAETKDRLLKNYQERFKNINEYNYSLDRTEQENLTILRKDVLKEYSFKIDEDEEENVDDPNKGEGQPPVDANTPPLEPGMPNAEGPVPPPVEQQPPMPQDNDVQEIDVSEIVAKADEAKMSSERANQKIDDVIRKLDDLSANLDKMSTIDSKIDDLEQDIIKRNPTPKEKLEISALNAFPYSVKLTDYFSDVNDKSDNYEIKPQMKIGDSLDQMKDDEEKEHEEEFKLTQKDIDDDYNESEVKKSLKYNYDEKFNEEIKKMKNIMNEVEDRDKNKTKIN